MSLPLFAQIVMNEKDIEAPLTDLAFDFFSRGGGEREGNFRAEACSYNNLEQTKQQWFHVFCTRVV